MHKELHSIKLIRDYMVSKKILKNETNNIEDIYSFFKYLSSEESKLKFNSLYVLNYIYSYITSNEVAKRKTSARVFEDLLAIIFNGIVTDSEERKNIKSEVPEYFKLTKDKMAGNKREKIDLLFNEKYGVSVKTLMIDNQEINLGSFEKKVLFDGFNVIQYLTERKTESTIGLGSKPRLKELLTLIEKNGQYNDFKERLVQMYDFIFADDMILAIKDNKKISLYFFTGKEFTNLVSLNSEKIDSLLTIINRWEGNSIRIDRNKLIQSATKSVELDLTILDKTVIRSVNELDYKLHKIYIEYFNEDNNKNLKDELIKSLDILFKEFEEKISELK